MKGVLKDPWQGGINRQAVRTSQLQLMLLKVSQSIRHHSSLHTFEIFKVYISKYLYTVISPLCSNISFCVLQLSLHSVQFSSFAHSCPTLCDPMNCSTPGLPVHHQLPEFTQTHVHRVGDAIQPSHPLSSPSPPAPSPSQHQSLFRWVNSSHEAAKLLEFQL